MGGLLHSLEHSPSREANRSLSNEEIPRILWDLKVQGRIQKRPPPVFIMSQSIQSMPPHLTSWMFTLILSSYLRLGVRNGLIP